MNAFAHVTADWLGILQPQPFIGERGIFQLHLI